MEKNHAVGLPSKMATIDFTKNLCIALFPAVEGGVCHSVSQRKLEQQFLGLLKPMQGALGRDPQILKGMFMDSLPETRKALEADAAFILANDPAATCLEEVILTYPGFYAILVFRLANSMFMQNVPLIPRIMTEFAHSVTGIDIHPGATIGREFCIDHGTGIVIGETSVIGDRVKIYQGVTIGALSIRKDMATTKRHPTIENDVIIYAGSTILGGNTIIGHDSIVGGNVWLTKSVPPFSFVQHESKVTIGTRRNTIGAQ